MTTPGEAQYVGVEKVPPQTPPHDTWNCEACGDQALFSEMTQCTEGCSCGRWVGPCCARQHGRMLKRRVDGDLAPEVLYDPSFGADLRIASIEDLLPGRQLPWTLAPFRHMLPVDAVSAELGLDPTFIKADEGMPNLKADVAVATTYWLLASRPALWEQFVSAPRTPAKRGSFLLGLHFGIRVHRGGLPPLGPVKAVNRMGIPVLRDLT